MLDIDEQGRRARVRPGAQERSEAMTGQLIDRKANKIRIAGARAAKDER